MNTQVCIIGAAPAGLRIAGWLAMTALAALGLVAIIFFAIGSFTIAGTMLQLDNLASRYIAADSARQVQFDALLAGATLIAFATIGVLRGASLLQILPIPSPATTISN